MIHEQLPWPIADDRPPYEPDVTDLVGAEPDLVEEANRTAGLAALGLVVGVILTKIVDLAIGGPGILVMVGL